ncbi:MAG: CDP-glycerol glycerophosphotransferase family protein, partial [Oliverpabstia sp.]
DIMEVLNIFDMLITDYSSIYIDYLLTGKPVMFLPYDREEYLKERGMNFDYDQVTPGPKPKTLKEFLNSVYELLYNHNSYGQQRADVNRFFNEIQEPCCEKICEKVKSLTGRYR